MTFKASLLPYDETRELGSSTTAWRITRLNLPTTSGGTTYGPGSANQALLSNGSTVYWGTISSSDTKNTVGSTQSTSKLFLVGPTAQSASAQSYSHTAVYATAGAMAATSYKVAEKVNLQYNSTTNALDFVFV